jgi:hypothetical protein
MRDRRAHPLALAHGPLVDAQYRASMVARAALRVVLFVTLVLAVWTISHPASAAAAALCDDRGASVIAPPPPLEASDEAIQRERIPDECLAEGILPLGARISPAPRGISFSFPSADQAVPIVPARLATSAGTESDFLPRTARAPTGVRSRVERPPRSGCARAPSLQVLGPAWRA